MKIYKLANIAILFAILPLQGFADSISATSTSIAEAEVINPLTTSSIETLNFGLFQPGTDGGDVYINAVTNQRQLSGSVTSLDDNNNIFSRASFSIVGDPDRNYTVQFPSEIFIKRNSQKKGQPLHTVFHSFSKNKGEIGNLGFLDKTGKDDLYVGGKLFFDQKSLPGHYITKVDVTVGYQ